MNSASKIEISKSSLLSLKAEILRKQQEVYRARLLQTQIQQTQTPLREKVKNNLDFEPQEPSNKGVGERQARDEVEDIDMLEKSRRMLESKARLYDRLVQGTSKLTEEEIDMNKHYLVQFDRKDKYKKKFSSDEEHISDDEEHFSDEYEPANNPDEEWVEYTDCLGRTRKCLRKDLIYLKKKDSELSKTLDPEGKKIQTDIPKLVSVNEENNKIDDSPGEIPDDSQLEENSELFSGDMRKELLRQEWERQEQELMNKKNIHYQDVLFSEARSHGVGYYAFSQDEEVRAKQQDELRKLRQETKEQQQSNLEQKSLREKQLAARIKAAKNRKRARMGLPPEEDEPEIPATQASNTEVTEEEKLKMVAKEAEEKAKEEERRKQIRPWDIGKDGVKAVKKHYEHTQEEWVDKQRSERPKEFAPPSFYNPPPISKPIPQIYENEEQDNYCEEKKSLYFTTKKTINKKIKSDFTSLPQPNFQSHSQSINPYKSNNVLNDDIEETYFCHPALLTPTPIENECVDFDEEQDDKIRKNEPYTRMRGNTNVNDCIDFDDEQREEERKHFEEQRTRKRAEIPPPPTFDYYGPSSAKRTNINVDNKQQNLEECIAAGLRFLREKAEKEPKRLEDFI